jgi:hypothetical protein
VKQPNGAREFVFLFPKDPARWFPFSRRIVSAPVDASGAFTVRDLAPGEYFVAAAPDGTPPGRSVDLAAYRASFESLAPVASSVVLPDDYQRITIDLRRRQERVSR